MSITYRYVAVCSAVSNRCVCTLAASDCYNGLRNESCCRLVCIEWVLKNVCKCYQSCFRALVGADFVGARAQIIERRVNSTAAAGEAEAHEEHTDQLSVTIIALETH